MSDEQTRNPGTMIARTLVSDEWQKKIKMALPPSISLDRFTRAAITAIQTNPAIVEGEKGSLYLAIQKAALDGLQLDGKEAALIIYNTKVKLSGGREAWVKTVNYQPMVAGIIKNLGKAGVHVDAQCVYENDVFKVIMGDYPNIVHEPTPLGRDKGLLVGCYAIMRSKDGVWREVMDTAQVEAVRDQSKQRDSLMWTKFREEGYRKSVIRRCQKHVPIYDESVQRMNAHEDEEFDFTDDIPSVDPSTVVSEQAQQSQTDVAGQGIAGDKPQPAQEARRSPPPADKGNRRPKALAAALAHEDAPVAAKTADPAMVAVQGKAADTPKATPAAAPKATPAAIYKDPPIAAVAESEDSDDDVF